MSSNLVSGGGGGSTDDSTTDDGGSTDDGGGGSDDPGWFTQARMLFTGGGLVAGGVALYEDPVGFIQNVVAEWIVGGFFDLFAEIGGLILLVNQQIQGALGSAGGSVADSLGGLTLLWDVPLDVLESILLIAIENSGPLAPLVWVGSWVGVLILSAVLVRATIEVVRVAW